MNNGQTSHSMTTKKLRRKLSGYGLRGQSLKLMLRHIMAGPQGNAGQSDQTVFAFGWTRDLMNRHMRRALIKRVSDTVTQPGTTDPVAGQYAYPTLIQRRSVVSINRRYLG